MGRLLIIVAIIMAIWFFFFRKKRPIKDNIEKVAHDMIECDNCKTYVSKDEAIFANGKWYCSKECLINKDK